MLFSTHLAPNFQNAGPKDVSTRHRVMAPVLQSPGAITRMPGFDDLEPAPGGRGPEPRPEPVGARSGTPTGTGFGPGDPCLIGTYTRVPQALSVLLLPSLPGGVHKIKSV